MHSRVTTSLSPVALSRMTDRVGQVLSERYRLLAPIGTGASASVYLADDVTLRRRVAVKILHDALAGDEAFLRRFRAEAQAAAALNHPHIMSVFDWGHDDVPFLVTEYLGGGSLRTMLDHGPPAQPGPDPDGRPRGRPRARLRPPARASSTATSSRPTCSSTRRPGCASPTSAWPGRWPRRPGPSRRARCWARPATPRPSRPGARPSTAAATSTRSPWS